MKLGIMGTRGIPNNYGGFEQFAEHLSLGLVNRGHEVLVYNSHNHPYRQSVWNGVQIVHKYDPEKQIGTAGQFIYDLNCIIDSRKRGLDALLNLGYTSSSVWGRLFPNHPVVITNMDGLEWKRSKYSNSVKKFLHYAEKLAIRHSDLLIADSKGIQDYLTSRYQITSHFIPYGAPVFTSPQITTLQAFGVKPGAYNLLIARMEPENNIEMILEGACATTTKLPFLVIGNCGNEFGKKLVDKFRNEPEIQFLGAIYDTTVIDNLRHFSGLYFHGHSVGGTNPSLLEAMGCGALIAAHDNEFNRSVLDNDAYYFSNAEEVRQLVNAFSELLKEKRQKTENNLQKIRDIYSWPTIVNSYEKVILDAIRNH